MEIMSSLFYAFMRSDWNSNVGTETDSICLQVQTQIIYDWIELAHAFLGSCYWGFVFFFNPLKSRETQANLTKIMKSLKRQSIVVSNWEKIYIVTERAHKSYLIPLGATTTGVFGKWNPSGGWNVGW